MQLVSDLQQRPKKGRLKMEKIIVLFYDLCSLIQIVTTIIHTVTTYIGSDRTFVNNFFVNSDFKLAPALVYKTRNCTFTTVRNIYAFNNVSMSFNSTSINDVFVDNALQMRLAIFVMAVTVLLGCINRLCIEINFFSFTWRSFTIYKDVLSATELLLLGYVLQIGVAAKPPAELASDYLAHCGVVTKNFLPNVSLINMYVFTGVGYFCYLVGLCLYLYNSLPKYGVMTPEEIEEYKEWLRARRADIEQSRQLIEQAKQAHARVRMMQSAEYNVAQARNDREKGRPTFLPPLPPGGYYGPPPPQAGGPAGYAPPPPPPLPFYEDYNNMNTMNGPSNANGYYPYPGGPNPNMPPPQVFGQAYLNNNNTIENYNGFNMPRRRR